MLRDSLVDISKLVFPWIDFYILIFVLPTHFRKWSLHMRYFQRAIGKLSHSFKVWPHEQLNCWRVPKTFCIIGEVWRCTCNLELQNCYWIEDSSRITNFYLFCKCIQGWSSSKRSLQKTKFFTKLLTSEVFLQKELFQAVFETSHLPSCCTWLLISTGVWSG